MKLHSETLKNLQKCQTLQNTKKSNKSTTRGLEDRDAAWVRKNTELITEIEKLRKRIELLYAHETTQQDVLDFLHIFNSTDGYKGIDQQGPPWTQFLDTFDDDSYKQARMKFKLKPQYDELKSLLHGNQKHSNRQKFENADPIVLRALESDSNNKDVKAFINEILEKKRTPH